MPDIFDENIHILHLAPPAPSSSIVAPNFLPSNATFNDEKSRRKIVPKRIVLLLFAFLASSILVANQIHLLYNFSRRMDQSRFLDMNAAADDDDATIDRPTAPVRDMLSWYPDEVVEWSANPKMKRIPRNIKKSIMTKSNSTSIRPKTTPKATINNTTKPRRQNDKRAKALKDNKPRKKQLPWSLPPHPQNQTTSVQFMKELSAYKKSLGIPLPWETTPRSNLSLPIISLSLPKSATTTTRMYFSCAKLTTAHTNRPFATTRIGDCMRDNFLNGTSPFHGCETNVRTKKVVDVWTDIGIPDDHCFYSSVHDGGLEHIAKFYPNATLLLVVRDSESWIASFKKWAGGRLLKKWIDTCSFPLGKPVKREEVTDRDWKDFYEAHTEKVRQFAKKYPHMTYVEVELGESSANMMEFYSGIPRSCFGDCHPGKKHVSCGPVTDKPEGDGDDDDDDDDEDDDDDDSESESQDQDDNGDDDDDDSKRQRHTLR